MREALRVAALLLTIIVCWGCASPAERDARRQWETARRSEGYLPARAPRRDRAFSSRAVHESPELDEAATLADYLAYAALNNPGLEAAFVRWRASLERIPQVRALPDPRFTYGYFIRNVETRVGPQRHRFGVAQTFPWFQKLMLQADVATEDARAMQRRYEAEKLKLFYRVKKAYYEYYYLARAIEVTEDNLRLLSSLEAVARSRYRAGAPLHANMVKLQVELGKLEDRLRSLRLLRKPLTARLNAAMNRPTDARLPWPKREVEQHFAFEDEEIFQWLREANPELRVLAAEIAREQKAVDLAWKQFYPDLTVGMDYIETGEAISPDQPDSGKDPVVAMFTVTVPVWYQKYRAGVREARARHRARLKQRADRENVLLADVRMTLYKIRDARRKIRLYRDTLVPKAEQSLRAAQNAFQAAESGFLDLIDAERVLLEFQLSYERAITDYATGLAELEMMVGRELGGEPAVAGEGAPVETEAAPEGKEKREKKEQGAKSAPGGEK